MGLVGCVSVWGGGEVASGRAIYSLAFTPALFATSAKGETALTSLSALPALPRVPTQLANVILIMSSRLSGLNA